MDTTTEQVVLHGAAELMSRCADHQHGIDDLAKQIVKLMHGKNWTVATGAVLTSAINVAVNDGASPDAFRDRIAVLNVVLNQLAEKVIARRTR